MSAVGNLQAANDLRERELGATTLKIPPTQIDGTKVRPVGIAVEDWSGGDLWQKLVPAVRQCGGVVIDARVWEFSLTTGRLVQTQF